MSLLEMKADGKTVRPKMVRQVLDTTTVLTVQVARGCSARFRHKMATHSPEFARRKVHSVTLLLQESTNNLFFGHANMRHSGAATVGDPRWMDISPLNMSPLFASGELLAMTCFDRFAVEALFTPQVVPLIRMFLFGDKFGNSLYQLACPRQYCGSLYGSLLSDLLLQGQILIGLLRAPDAGGSTFCGDELELEQDDLADLPDASLPYVMTNPAPDKVTLKSTDLIFLIGDRSKCRLLQEGAEACDGDNPVQPQSSTQDLKLTGSSRRGGLSLHFEEESPRLDRGQSTEVIEGAAVSLRESGKIDL